MKKILAIIVLSLCLITPSQADDITDFQIEGISVGDSVLDHPIFKNYIKGVTPYKNKKYSPGFIRLNTEVYEEIEFFYLKKDKKKIIETISGQKYYNNNIGECLKEKKIIENELSNLFRNLKSQNRKKIHSADPSKKSMLYAFEFYFPEGHVIQVSCTDWVKHRDLNGKIRNYRDNLNVSISLKSFVDFVIEEAWK